MKIRKLSGLFLTLLLTVSLCPINAFASEEKPDISKFELPKPATPNYMMYEAADRTATEGDDALYIVRQTDMSVLELSVEEYQDRDAFLEKYGLYDFCIIMQYDSSLDGTDNWNYNSEWDTSYYALSPYEACCIAWIGEDMIGRETLFDLYGRDPNNDTYHNMSDAIIHREVPDGDYSFDNYYFDHENHSLYIRCRYYMEWETYDGEEVGERQSKYSEWSDVAVFGKDSTAITPVEPTGYEAPIISDLKYVQPGEGTETGSLTYVLNTPESVWNAAIYYVMTENGNFDCLETQICIDDGEWQEYTTIDGWSNWGLSSGIRTAYTEEPKIEAGSNIKLRVRYTGTHGESEWSNVIEINDGGTNVVPEETEATKENTEGTTETGQDNTQTTTKDTQDDNNKKDKCKLCGFCPMPLGLCIFIWLIIIVVIIIVIVIIIVVANKNKKKKSEDKEKER